MDIVDKITKMLIIDSIMWKKVIRKGKVQRKLICPPGFKAKDGHCVKMDVKSMLKMSRSAKRAQKKLHTDTSKEAKLLRKRTKSLKKRADKIPGTVTKKLEK